MQALIALQVAVAQPTRQELTEAWVALREELGAAELPVPPLSNRELARLAGGEVVARRVEEAGGIDRVVGFGWMDHAQDEVWLAFHDEAHMSSVEDLVERQLAGTTPQLKVLYQHAELPLPLADRHWVLRIRNNEALFEASEGRLWERTWELDPRGEGALEDLPAGLCLSDGAVWTPYNEGGYWLLPVTGGTLMVYQVRFDAGGWLPEELVVRGTMMKMDEMMRGIDAHADELPDHYLPEHRAIERPDRSEVPYYRSDAGRTSASDERARSPG